ncbi:MAG: hypothetical protein PHQ75_09290 [Thermoguttaceae bacterium]|nr:hypothetical protein [Thermoguttaceae bacterium]
MRQTFFTLGTIVADSEKYLPEWLTFHYLTGVERFALVLEGDCEAIEKQIRRLPFRRLIWTYRFREVWDRVKIYDWLLGKFGRKTHWMGFLDPSEFLFGTVEDDVRNILVQYEKFGGLMAHWLNFGSNGHFFRPDGLSIEAFSKRAVDSFRIHHGLNTVFQPAKFRRFLSANLVETDYDSVREDGQPIEIGTTWGTAKDPIWNSIRINRYQPRSRQDWVESCTPGNAFEKKQLADLFYHLDRNEIFDPLSLRYAARMKSILR